MIPANKQMMSSGPRRRVAVLLGGDSAERDISLESGANVMQALQTAGHNVIPIDPREQSLEQFDWQHVDVAFIALHGTHGEDGDVQQQFDRFQIPYTGSGAASSAIAFHKVAAKERFLEHGLATPEFAVVSAEMEDGLIQRHADRLGWPLVVKPEAQGSSLGVSILESPAQLLTAIALARSFGELVLLETAVTGQEWTVPILDDVPLPAIRIGTPHLFFDFDAKYRDEKTVYDVIADPEDEPAAKVQQLSVRACQSLGCRGISRVDLRMDQSGKVWLLEVNTVPGMTGHSLVPKSAEAYGWSMPQLCEKIIQSAFQTH